MPDVLTAEPRLLRRAILDQLTNDPPESVTIYDGDITKALALNLPDDYAGPIPRTSDGRATSRVLPYVVLYGGGGGVLPWSFAANRRLLSTTVQATCAAGLPDDHDGLVHWVRHQVTGWRPDADLFGEDVVVRVDPIRELGDPGPMRRDDDVTPVRFYTPIVWRCPTVRSS